MPSLACVHQPLAAHGFDGRIYDHLGELLVDMLASDEFVSTCPDGKRAWMLFFAFLVDNVRAHWDKNQRLFSVYLREGIFYFRIQQRTRSLDAAQMRVDGARDFFAKIAYKDNDIASGSSRVISLFHTCSFIKISCHCQKAASVVHSPARVVVVNESPCNRDAMPSHN